MKRFIVDTHGEVAQNGNAVTATNMPYNGTIAVGGDTSIGFVGSPANSNANPIILQP